jgi:hypothetical protein
LVTLFNPGGLDALRRVEATQVQQFELTDIQGIIEPFTYTDGDGTFTISEMSLTENPVTRSTISIDTSTGAIENRLVIDVAFNNGKPGALGANLFGTFTIEESGQLLPPEHPICQELSPTSSGCANLVITSGVLTGGGPFAGTTAKGKNPIILPGPEPSPEPCPNPDPPPPTIPLARWSFSPPDSPPNILVDLPSPPFIDGQNIPIHGEITACLNPLSVGGTVEFFADGSDAPVEGSPSGSSGALYAALAGGIAAGVLAIAAGGWYARRRWLR